MHAYCHKMYRYVYLQVSGSRSLFKDVPYVDVLSSKVYTTTACVDLIRLEHEKHLSSVVVEQRVQFFPPRSVLQLLHSDEPYLPHPLS